MGPTLQGRSRNYRTAGWTQLLWFHQLNGSLFLLTTIKTLQTRSSTCQVHLHNSCCHKLKYAFTSPIIASTESRSSPDNEGAFVACQCTRAHWLDVGKNQTNWGEQMKPSLLPWLLYDDAINEPRYQSYIHTLGQDGDLATVEKSVMGMCRWVSLLALLWLPHNCLYLQQAGDVL